MIKIMIVEDEYLVRIGIKTIISEILDGDVCIVGDVSTGEEGLSIYKQYMPDIIIADIQLPKMNGLEMIKMIRDKNDDVELIIISCHTDFSYAKKAIEYGVSEYVEKSEMDPNYLLDIVRRLAEKINKKKKSKISGKNGVEIVGHNDLLKKVFLGEISKEEKISELLSELQLPSQADRFAIILFKIVASDSVDVDNNIISALAKESMTEKLRGAIYKSNNGECYVLMTFDKRIHEGLFECENFTKRVIKEFKGFSESVIKILIAPLFCDVNQIKKTYSEMQDIKEYMLFADEYKLITLNEIRNRISERSIKVLNYDDLFRLTINGEKRKVEEWILDIFHYIKNNKYSLINLKSHCNQLVTNLNRVMNYYYEYFKDIYQETYFKYTNINNNVSIDDIERWCLKTYEEITEYCNRFKFYQGDNNIVKQTINFMLDHHNEALSLEDIAVHCNISKVYLCQLFKKETNRTLTDIFNEMKIEKAKLLIELDDYKIYEVAERVGFKNNSSYFNKVFKKLTGYTPLEYRDKIILDKNI